VEKKRGAGVEGGSDDGRPANGMTDRGRERKAGRGTALYERGRRGRQPPGRCKRRMRESEMSAMPMIVRGMS
jgi:hypothetical protein